MKGDKPRICVVGSLVIDLVFKVQRRPGPGETMLARGFGMFLGGKGFNQAVAAERLGADVSMVGRLGKDTFGDMFMAKLEQEGIDSSRVTRDPEAGTAIASPVIDASGENSIIAAPRANMRVTPGHVLAAEEQIAAADVLMLQFEIPVAASRTAAEIARKRDTLVVLDPAPVEHGFERFNAPIDFIVPNEIEAHMLTGRMTLDEWGAVLLPETRQGVVISLGDKGAAAFDRSSRREFPAYQVKVVDTTGAGDAFRAGLAVMLAQGKPLDDAVRFANACGALACTIMGAEPSMPRLEVVDHLLAHDSLSLEGRGRG
jgi:ribokinase